MTTTFVPNPVGMAAIAVGVGVQAVLERLGEAIAEGARSAAPEDEGDYIDGIVVEDGEAPGSKRVLATDFKSNWIEYGTEDTPAFAPLRLGADSAGVPLVEGGD